MFLKASPKTPVLGLRRVARGAFSRPLTGLAGRLLRRATGLALAALLAVQSGCSFKKPQSFMDAHGLVSRDQLSLFMVTVWVSLFIFITVGGAMAVIVWVYREKPGDENKPMPSQGHGNPLVEISLITASIALLVIIAVPTLKAIFLTDSMPTDQPYWKPSLLGNWYSKAGGDVPEGVKNDPLTIEVDAKQWWWSFYYKQFGFTTANELYLPAGRVVIFQLRSDNVIHSFWLPKLAGKVDCIPGRANDMWMMADDGAGMADGYDHGDVSAAIYENGLYYGQCAQYCGESHAFMLFRARVVSDKDFVAWVNHSLTKAKAPIADGSWDEFRDKVIVPVTEGKQPADPAMYSTDAQKGAALFFGRAKCTQCHSIDGSPAQGTAAPNLTHVASRTAIAAGFLDNLNNDGTAIDPARQRENFYNWISDSYDIKPGNLMWFGFGGTGGLRDIVALNKANGTPITDQDWHDIAAYLMTLK